MFIWLRDFSDILTLNRYGYPLDKDIKEWRSLIMNGKKKSTFFSPKWMLFSIKLMFLLSKYFLDHNVLK